MGSFEGGVISSRVGIALGGRTDLVFSAEVQLDEP